MPSTIAGKSQQRAQYAYKSVKNCIEGLNTLEGLLNEEKKKMKDNFLSPDQLKDFRSHVKNIPMMMRTNGLASTFAFVFSKAKSGDQKNQKKDYTAIERITGEWLKEIMNMTLEESQTFHEKLITLNAVDYRLYTKEIFALFTWLKRYVDGLIKD